MNIYVVMGTCGEYSDRSEWAVCALTDETKAQNYVVAAEKRADEIHTEYKERIWDIPSGANEFDPDMKTVRFYRTTYYYETAPLKE